MLPSAQEGAEKAKAQLEQCECCAGQQDGLPKVPVSLKEPH